MSISTNNLSSLPSIEKLKRLSQSIAMLDAIICQEWEWRYYSFNSKWFDHEMMASMRNGQGSHYFILFFKEGSIIKGFDVDALISTDISKEVLKNQLDQIPTQFSTFLEEPAFTCDEATFFIWKLNKDSQWNTLSLNIRGIDDKIKTDDFDGAKHLISILDGNPLTYKEWAENYYEGNYDLSFIQKIYQHEPLTQGIAKDLNPDIEYETLMEDIKEIGYPCGINIGW